MPRFTKARDTHRAGRLGRDQETAWEEMRKDLHDCLNDPESDLGDLHAVLAEHLPEEASQIHREVAEDRRGVHAWARDRRERRRLAKDFGVANLTGSGSPSVEEFERNRDKDSTALDRRRTAHDMAFDARAKRNPSLASFRARYPHAARIERF